MKDLELNMSYSGKDRISLTQICSVAGIDQHRARHELRKVKPTAHKHLTFTPVGAIAVTAYLFRRALIT
jgi:hypothetical protein